MAGFFLYTTLVGVHWVSADAFLV